MRCLPSSARTRKDGPSASAPDRNPGRSRHGTGRCTLNRARELRLDTAFFAVIAVTKCALSQKGEIALRVCAGAKGVLKVRLHPRFRAGHASIDPERTRVQHPTDLASVRRKMAG